MQAVRLPIKGLRYHDFEGRLDELYELAPKRHIALAVEHENEMEPDAVIAYLSTKHVGYVRTSERLKAIRCIEKSGRESISCKVVEIDRVGRVLWVEVNTEAEICSEVYEDTSMLGDWEFGGPVLHQKEDVLRLHIMCDTLEYMVEDEVPWDDEMEEIMVFLEQNVWKDMSWEMRHNMERLLYDLTKRKDVAGYADAGMRVQYAMDFMGSVEARRLQIGRLKEIARSKDMDLLMSKYGDDAVDAVDGLPLGMKDLFVNDAEMVMGRLWYLRIRKSKLKAVETLLCMCLRLKDDMGEDAGDVEETKVVELPNLVVGWIRESARCTNLFVKIMREKVVPMLGRKVDEAKWAHVLKVLNDMSLVASLGSDKPKAFGDLVSMIIPGEKSENVVKGVTNHKDKLPNRLFRRFDDNDINKVICEKIADAFGELMKYKPKEED